MPREIDVRLPKGVRAEDVVVHWGKAPHVLTWQGGVFMAHLISELIRDERIGPLDRGNWKEYYIELLWLKKGFAVKVTFAPEGTTEAPLIVDVGTISDDFDPVLGSLVEDIIDSVYFLNFKTHIKRKFPEVGE